MSTRKSSSNLKSFRTIDGLKIRLHPTMDILLREDGAYLITGPHRNSKWRFGTKNLAGYLQVKFHGKPHYVHRLMAETFLPNPQNKPTVDHIDRNPSNNFLSNLRWATQSEQNENSSIVLDAADYEVRYKDDPNGYKRAWSKAHPESRRESQRRYARKRRSEQDTY